MGFYNYFDDFEENGGDLDEDIEKCDNEIEFGNAFYDVDNSSSWLTKKHKGMHVCVTAQFLSHHTSMTMKYES